jgi:hypothetical protein
MAKRYKSTVQVVCWKKHTCAGCGNEYAYLLSRKAVGSSTSAAGAQRAMQKRVAYITENETDMHPCPGCGLFQYDMIAQRRKKSRLQFLTVALIAFATLLIIRGTHGLQSNTVTAIAAVVAVLVVLAHLLLETQNANSDLAANLVKAQQRLTDGTLRQSQPRTGPDQPLNQPVKQGVNQAAALARPGRPMLHNLALLMLLLSPIVIVMPEAIRTVRGWPFNDDCYPPVVGATDHTRVYLPDSISSVKGYWRGTPHAWLHYAGTFKESASNDGAVNSGQELLATTNENNWSSTISDVKSGEEATKSHPWVEVTMPDDAGLAGKTVSCEILLSLSYPESTGSGTFQTVSRSMQHKLDIRLAPRGAGTQYDTLWWIGTAGGGGLIVLASLILWAQARAFGKLAIPTEVFPATPAAA